MLTSLDRGLSQFEPLARVCDRTSPSLTIYSTISIRIGYVHDYQEILGLCQTSQVGTSVQLCYARVCIESSA